MTATVLTPPARLVTRRWWFWVAIGAIVVVVGIVSTLVGVSRAPGTPLSPTNPQPEGAKALAQVLAAHGIDVVVPATLADAVAAAGEPGTTLLLDDPGALIGSYGNAAILASGAVRILLLEPVDTTVTQYGVPADDASPHSGDDDALRPGCALPGVQRAGAITGDAELYRATGSSSTACWLGPDGVAAMLVTSRAGQEITILGTTGSLENQSIQEAGNAAFALGELGATPRLVWFQPAERAGWTADQGGTGAEGTAEAPTIGSVSPGWVVPTMLLLVAVLLAAAMWRGRRFGRLVLEPLPSIVPADETVRGRARLYARASARLRAADALRIGTIDRLATMLGQPASASVEAVAAAVAAITGRPVAAILALLRDEEPATDSALLRLSDELRRLETELTGRMKP